VGYRFFCYRRAGFVGDFVFVTLFLPSLPPRSFIPFPAIAGVCAVSALISLVEFSVRFPSVVLWFLFGVFFFFFFVCGVL